MDVLSFFFIELGLASDSYQNICATLSMFLSSSSSLKCESGEKESIYSSSLSLSVC